MPEIEKPITAFILMQFDAAFDRLYSEIIEPALAESGCIATRADSDLDQVNIMQKIIQSISRTDIIIAEVTSLNPNVMYELGIAHGLDKPTVILTQDIDSVPFDLRSYTLVKYTEHYQEIPKLQRKLRDLVERFRNGEVQFRNPVRDFVLDVSLNAHVSSFGENKAVETVEPLDDDDEELGWLDLQVAIEEGLAEIKTDTERLGEVASRFTEELSDETDRLNRLPSPTAAHKHAASMRVAQLLTTFATELETLGPRFRVHWSVLEEHSEALFASIELKSDADRQNGEKLISTVQSFIGQVDGAASAISNARTSLNDLRGISKPLNRAITRTERALDEAADAFSIGKSFANRLINIVQERLDASSGSN